MGSDALKTVSGIVAPLVVAGVIGWVCIRALKRSDDPARLVFKWILSLPMLGVLVVWVVPAVGQGEIHPVIGVPVAAAFGLALTIIWGHSLISALCKPLLSIFDGGNEEPVPQPLYSIARSLQKKGRYHEAVLEIHKQLERFPTDVEGQLLLAQIQAEDLKDMPGAGLTIERFCAQPGHAPANIAFALYSLADWHLKISQDRESAQRALERVIALLPESEFALGAAHRIAHLGSAEMLLASHDRKKFTVIEGPRNIGLMSNREHLKPAEADPEQEAAECVKHLAQHPLDTEAREQLAVIYADHYGRLDLAAGELEQMIAQPNQPGKLVVRWLNLLADLQIRNGAGEEAVRQTLQRIVDRAPNLAAAEIARNRLALLKLEMKGKEKSQAVKLGSYEQNIGLKRGLPRR